MISKFKFPINNIIHPRVNLSEVRENMYCIYLIRNTLNNKIYIGKHKYKNSRLIIIQDQVYILIALMKNMVLKTSKKKY